MPRIRVPPLQLWVYEDILGLHYQDCPNESDDIHLDENFSENDGVKVRKHKGRSVFARCKRRDRMTKMLWRSNDSNGIYFDVQSGGVINHAKRIEVSVQMSAFHSEVLIRDRSSLEDNFYQYLWTSKNKRIRLKNRVRCNSDEKKKKSKIIKKKKIVQTESEKADDMNCQKKGDKEREKMNHRNGDDNNRDTSSDGNQDLRDIGDDDDDDDDQDVESLDGEANYEDKESMHKFLKIKKLPRKLSYIFSDAYLNTRHSNSKRKAEEIKHLLCDPILLPNKTTNVQIPQNDSSKDGKESETHPPILSFGSFFTIKNLAKLGLDKEFETIKEKVEAEMKKVTTLIPLNVDGTKDDIKESEHVSNEKESIFQNDGFFVAAGEMFEDDSANHEKHFREKIEDSSIRVTLPHLSLRPDNLKSEFKEKYKEASCKKRRFLLDISNLAHQHLIQLNSIPHDIKLESDINMYLVFSYLEKAHEDIDKYRVWINSTFSLIKPLEAFCNINDKKLTSLHEIIHTAIGALKDISIDKVLRHKKNHEIECIDKFPVCAFNLLQSVLLKMYLNLQGSKQTNTNNSNSAAVSSSVSYFPANSGISSIEALRGYSFPSSIVYKGPSEASMCGICLRDFDTKSVFPIALIVCSHWFCEECWKSKLSAQIKDKKHEFIFCIERGCDTKVDWITLMSVMDFQLVQNYQNMGGRNIFAERPNQTYCLNISCKRPLISMEAGIETNKFDLPIPISCFCSWQYCPRCFENPHWPVSCDISKIYLKCLEAQALSSFNSRLEDHELPELMLRGKSCPDCRNFIQEKNNQSKMERCACGCLFCWPCGKKINPEKTDSHSSCLERFELSDMKLKDKVIKHHSLDESKTQISRWFNIALNHRKWRHPQVVKNLYEMADQLSVKIFHLLESGKNIGDAKSAANGWKSAFRRWNNKRYRRLKKSKQSGDDIQQDFSYSREASSSSSASDTSEAGSSFEFTVFQHSNLESAPPLKNNAIAKQQSASNTLILKALCNIVQTKVEMHQIIENTAVMLEFDHSLNQSGLTGKIIRSLERLEDLSEVLGLLLQDAHSENTSRIIASFLRVRLQAKNTLSALSYLLETKLKKHSYIKETD